MLVAGLRASRIIRVANDVTRSRDAVAVSEAERLKAPLSKTHIDRFGDRLRADFHGKDDVELLDAYRRSFDDAYQTVVGTLRELGFEPTGRPAKSTLSIIEKLRRESIRFSQMQDVAGCRIVVPNVVDQDSAVATMRAAFPSATVVDRREKPSYGYRGVHVIVEISEKPIEIQVRSWLQHLWAELSEKLSDVRDPGIKYGAGPYAWQLFLTRISAVVARAEEAEVAMADLISLIPSKAETDKVPFDWLQLETAIESEFASRSEDNQ